MTISFWHCGSNKPEATEFAIKNVRKHHPDAYYHLCSDGQNYEALKDIANRYNCDFVFYDRKLGGPTQPYGYRKDGVLEFMSRINKFADIATSKYNSTHFMMMEDDVLVLKPVTVDPTWQHACHNVTDDNLMPEPMLNIIKGHCRYYPNVHRYGAGGGSIFNLETWLISYYYNTLFIKTHLDVIQSYYPTLGWIDCFLNVIYFNNGKKYTVNPHLTDTHNHKPGFDYDGFIKNLSPEIEIVNNYKRLYFNE